MFEEYELVTRGLSREKTQNIATELITHNSMLLLWSNLTSICSKTFKVRTENVRTIWNHCIVNEIEKQCSQHPFSGSTDMVSTTYCKWKYLLDSLPPTLKQSSTFVNSTPLSRCSQWFKIETTLEPGWFQLCKHAFFAAFFIHTVHTWDLEKPRWMWWICSSIKPSEEREAG